MVEEKARCELGMVKPDEIFVNVVRRSEAAARCGRPIAVALTIALLGAESTGKTHAGSRAMAAHLLHPGQRAGVVAEVLREWCDARRPHAAPRRTAADRRDQEHARRRGRARAGHRHRRHDGADGRRSTAAWCSRTAALLRLRAGTAAPLRPHAAHRASTCRGRPTACSAMARMCANRWMRWCAQRTAKAPDCPSAVVYGTRRASALRNALARRRLGVARDDARRSAASAPLDLALREVRRPGLRAPAVHGAARSLTATAPPRHRRLVAAAT